MAQETKYTWKREGRTEKFESAFDVVRRILRVNEEARNNDKVLEHIFWTEVEGLDLNDREDFMKKTSSATISRCRRKVQSNEGKHYPTDPEKIYKQTVKGDRNFKDIADFYKLKKPGVIDNYVKFIKNKVENGDLTEEEAEENMFGEIDVSMDDEEQSE